MQRTLSATVFATLLAAGCQSPLPRLNAPPHGVAESVHDMQGTFVYMTDNALLADMSISDMHFLPHRPLLSTLGKERLNRLSQLINAYGGTIRFNSNLTDAKLIEARSTTIMDYLGELGIDTSSEILARDLRGGEGMDAAEVILIKAGEATYDPKKAAQQDASATSLIESGN